MNDNYILRLIHKIEPWWNYFVVFDTLFSILVAGFVNFSCCQKMFSINRWNQISIDQIRIDEESCITIAAVSPKSFVILWYDLSKIFWLITYRVHLRI